MEITLNRRPSMADHTPGDLLIDGVHECFICEDVIREIPEQPVSVWKIQNKTAIGAGRYRVTIDYSNRFKQDMPHILNVPGFEGVRIHWGNTAEDTDGCLLVGHLMTPTGVAQSRLAFESFFPKLQAAVQLGPVWITVNNSEAS